MKTETMKLTPIAAAIGALILACAATGAMAQQAGSAADNAAAPSENRVVVTGSRSAKAVDKKTPPPCWRVWCRATPNRPRP
jgi:hypothetical protein